MIVFPLEHACGRCGGRHEVIAVPTKAWGVVRIYLCEGKPYLARGRQIAPALEIDTQPGLRSNWNPLAAATIAAGAP